MGAWNRELPKMNATKNEQVKLNELISELLAEVRELNDKLTARKAKKK
jgi:hypothetical protein